MNQADVRFVQDALARFEGPLIQYARRITGDVERARDVVQETFLRLCRQRRADVEDRVAEWLFTVCRNAAIDQRRKERPMSIPNASRGIPARPAGDDTAPDRAVEIHEQTRLAVSALDRLPPRQQEALRLRFQADLSYRDIARVMGSSVGNVGYLIHTGLLRLKEELCVTAPGGTR